PAACMLLRAFQNNSRSLLFPRSFSSFNPLTFYPRGYERPFQPRAAGTARTLQDASRLEECLTLRSGASGLWFNENERRDRCVAGGGGVIWRAGLFAAKNPIERHCDHKNGSCFA